MGGIPWEEGAGEDEQRCSRRYTGIFAQEERYNKPVADRRQKKRFFYTLAIIPPKVRLGNTA
jgi:hypothetical protein